MVLEAAGCSASTSQESGEELTLVVKWVGKDYTVRVCGDDTVGELKRRICEVTNVLPKRQKLLNVKKGSKPADDSMLLSGLGLKPAIKISMIGTVEDEIFVDTVDAPEVLDDFELGEEDTTDIKDKDINKAKIQRRVQQYKLKLLNPCRPGKKLLVLDIDYTLFDHRSTAENPLELMRPYLHEFLTAAYAAYDIIIWSATRFDSTNKRQSRKKRILFLLMSCLLCSMKWVEVKMKELGVLGNASYKITALLDHLAMITVQSESRGVFDCKPLGLIWGKLPEFYGPNNTIMLDDLKRNFVMNPQNGLVIRPFKKAHMNRGTDQELVYLAEYLLAIGDLDDLSGLDHKNWEKYSEQNKRQRHQ
ncbi:ubiquitin-like domain-containing CTD phosphatase isoform X1 [Selaginella moellendorffii]|uniref:ubiquitin-like domain-containing CTD phosphatase isoform X1 n=1 Tax=Selaginella moellendorffii TaxID=88036 RepID=UPI000D1C7F7D|nr:ubiquitin-like domain-containing CTD phosphatase isoform X1 [Selaginella moellendorffii]XP_024535319.1 ubiquitin-like domain-containing CTD phosphatase isoform X1 [Selaginella moellendorffii]|eukprot:XP_024520988.1 ubiquitin-like domain-containing CTD phosphatase isoform X1 [Selaginella moellendorffii]